MKDKSSFSLIICSRKKWISKELLENIERTIDSQYELIVIDNSEKKLSIFEAYNKGISRSHSEILVFMHDDILFQTKGWGKILIKLFNKNPGLGLLGIAGSTVKLSMPSTWGYGPGEIIINIIQHSKKCKVPIKKHQGFEKKSLVEVAAIDGVFMTMKADKRISFDTEIKSFHNYDLDLCLKHHLLNKKIFVTDEILIEHFSGGNINKDWYQSAHLFHKKNKHNFHLFNSQDWNKGFSPIEFSAGASYVINAFQIGCRKEALYWWKELIKMKILAKFHLKFVLILLGVKNIKR